MARILVVDDESSIRALVDRILSAKGHQVITVPDAHQVLSVMAKQTLDLIIVDIRMPGEDGLALLRKIRANHAKIPIAVYSGALDSQIEKELKSAGANVILAKNLGPEAFTAQIERILIEGSRLFEAGTMPDKGPILIVDDEAPIRELLRRFFEEKKLRTIQAASGEEAIRLAESEKPSVILLDMQMPGMDGLTALKGILKVNPAIGVVIVTGYDHPETVQKAMDLGAYSYVLKPFDFIYLELVVMSKLTLGGG